MKDQSLHDKVRQWLPDSLRQGDWQLIDALHQPRYGQFDTKLWQFCQSFQAQGLQLEPIYTGKALYSLFELIRNGQVATGSRISFFHTGGLQALKGLAYRGLIPTIGSAQ